MKSALVSHRQTHEANRTPMQRCQVCNKILASRGALKIHLRQHTNDKSFRCNQCVEAFSSAGQLKQHMTQDHGAISSSALDAAQLQAASILNSGQPSAFSQVVPNRSNVANQGFEDSDRLALQILYDANNELHLNVRRMSSDVDHSQNVIVEVGFLRDLISQGLTVSIPFSCDGAPETSITADPAALLELAMRDASQLNNIPAIESEANTSRGRIAEPPTPSAYLTTFPSGDGSGPDFAEQLPMVSTIEKSGEVAAEMSFIVECKICDLKFSNVYESKMHFQSSDHEIAMCMQRETNGPTHLCDICGKLFATRVRLLRHIRSHTGER